LIFSEAEAEPAVIMPAATSAVLATRIFFMSVPQSFSMTEISAAQGPPNFKACYCSAAPGVNVLNRCAVTMGTRCGKSATLQNHETKQAKGKGAAHGAAPSLTTSLKFD